MKSGILLLIYFLVQSPDRRFTGQNHLARLLFWCIVRVMTVTTMFLRIKDLFDLINLITSCLQCQLDLADPWLTPVIDTPPCYHGSTLGLTHTTSTSVRSQMHVPIHHKFRQRIHTHNIGVCSNIRIYSLTLITYLPDHQIRTP